MRLVQKPTMRQQYVGTDGRLTLEGQKLLQEMAEALREARDEITASGGDVSGLTAQVSANTSAISSATTTANGAASAAATNAGNIATNAAGIAALEAASLIKAIVAIDDSDSPYSPGDVYTVLCDASGGAITVSLDPTETGRIITIKKIDTSANAVTLNPVSGQIDGAASAVMASAMEAVTVHSDGSDWYVI